MKTGESTLREILKPAVIVGALGYFVDVYDLILFSIVRARKPEGFGLSRRPDFWNRAFFC